MLRAGRFHSLAMRSVPWLLSRGAPPSIFECRQRSSLMQHKDGGQDLCRLSAEVYRGVVFLGMGRVRRRNVFLTYHGFFYQTAFLQHTLCQQMDSTGPTFYLLPKKCRTSAEVQGNLPHTRQQRAVSWFRRVIKTDEMKMRPGKICNLPLPRIPQLY